MSKIHVFHYRYPGIQEGLVHDEKDDMGYITPDMVDAPVGAFIYHRGEWFKRVRRRDPYGHFSPPRLSLGHDPIPDAIVPKLIRTLLLIST